MLGVGFRMSLLRRRSSFWAARTKSNAMVGAEAGRSRLLAARLSAKDLRSPAKADANAGQMETGSILDMAPISCRTRCRAEGPARLGERPGAEAYKKRG